MKALCLKLTPTGFGLVFGLLHLLVDMVTVSTAFAASHQYGVSLGIGFSAIVLYDGLAFAAQPIIGWFSDRKSVYGTVALTGIALVAISVPLLSTVPLMGLICAGLGNAFFHVGGGALSLSVAPGRAAIPGIFVAPGAIGLGLGTIMGKSGQYYPLAFVGAMGVAALTLLKVSIPKVIHRAKIRLLIPSHSNLIVAALLLSIAIRALVGFGGSFACTKTFAVKVGLMTVAVLGKGLGGVVSDRIGWIPGSVGALFISAPLIAFFGDTPGFLLVGFLFFQMTMPVTLVAVSEVMPGRPGLAFGLCCLALVLGSLLSFSKAVQAIYTPMFFMALILVSALLIFFSLRPLDQRIPMKF